MADYNNPLEVQLKLTADATQITKTLEELKKQGIELPANLSKKNIDKAFETIQEQAKQKNISLSINESDFKNKIELITGAAKKRFQELGIELRKVFEADSVSGLQSKVGILKEIEALKKVTNFVPGLDTSFTAPDGKVIKTTKEYQAVLYGTIEALNKIKLTNFNDAVNTNAEETKLGLENLYNTSKKVLPVLANEFISLSKDTSTSADAIVGKFKEVYSVYKLFQSAASGVKKSTGESLPNTLSEKSYGDSINLDTRSFSETGKFGKVLKDILGDQQKVKDFTESIKKDSEQLQQIGLKAISSAVTNPVSQVAGTKGLAEAKQQLASADKEVNTQEQALNDTLKQDTTKQAIENFKRLAGETKGNVTTIGELQKTFDNLFIGTDKIISIEELSNVTNQINQLKDALVVLKKEKQLSVATNDNFIKNEDIKPYEDQIKNVEKFIAILSEYSKKKQQIEELQAKADTIKNSSNGIISKEQQESLNQIIAEINRIKPEAEKAEAAIVKLKDNYSKYLGANFKKPKEELIDGNEFLGKFTKSDLSENFLFIKNLNDIITTLGNTMNAVSNKGRGMSSALTSALQNIAQQSQDKISIGAEAIVKAEAEANAAKGVVVSQGEINNLKQKNLELETQIANTSKQSQATLEEKLRLEKQLEETKKEQAKIQEQAKLTQERELDLLVKAGALEQKLRQESREADRLRSGYLDSEREKKTVVELNTELEKKNRLLQEKVNNNSGVSLEQFNQIKDSVVQLNKAIAEKSNGLSESSKKDIECFVKIKEAVDNVRTTVNKMYDGVGSGNLSGKLTGLQSELKNVVPNDIIDTFVKKLNRIQITIEKFEANNAIAALKANIEKELTNIQFNATVPNSITGIGGVLSPSVQHLNDGIIEAYKQAEILRTNFNLTEEEAKKINGEITKLISTMNNKKASGVLTPEDLQKFEEQKQKIKDLTELYNSYNKATRDYSNILSKNKTLMNQASPMNQQALKDSMGNVGKIISGGINDESMRKYIEEVNTINSIAKEIKNEFNQIKLPTDLTAFINGLKTNRSYGISGSGLENLIIGYQKVNTELQRIATTDQEVTYAEKQNARTKLDDLGEQIRQFQIANKLLKEMDTLLRQSQNRSFTNSNVSTYVADLERLKANFSNVLTTTMGNAGNLSSEAITHFRDEVGKSNVAFLNLRGTIEEGIGTDRTSTQAAKLNYQINKLITDLNLFKMQNSTFTKDFGLNTQFNELASSLQRVQAEGKPAAATVMQLKSQIANFKTSVQMAGKMGRSFGDELSYIASKIGVKALLGGFTYRIISYFRKMINNVKELDTAMTSLKRVTDETEATYSRFEKTMGNVSQEIGTGYADLVNAVAEFSKLGYNMEQATELGKVASIYNKVGLIGNTDEAITSLVSIIKAFDISSNKAMDLVDKLNIVGGFCQL